MQGSLYCCPAVRVFVREFDTYLSVASLMALGGMNPAPYHAIGFGGYTIGTIRIPEICSTEKRPEHISLRANLGGALGRKEKKVKPHRRSVTKDKDKEITDHKKTIRLLPPYNPTPLPKDKYR